MGRVVSACSLVTALGLALAVLHASLAAELSVDPDLTLFEGVYFDHNRDRKSPFIQYLVKPFLKANQRNLNGAELHRWGEQRLRDLDPVIVTGLGLTEDNRRRCKDRACSLVVFYVFRAHHVANRSVLGTETLVSVGVSIHVFSPEAAMRDIKRFEAVYSRPHVLTVRHSTHSPLPEEKLKGKYREALRDALARVAELAVADLKRDRSFAEAAFQVAEVHLPKLPSPELDQLIDAELKANRQSVSAKTRKTRRLLAINELKMLLHSFLLNELEERDLRNVAVVPPENPWTAKHVVPHLRRLFPGSKFYAEVDVTAMNGYTVTAVLVKTYKTTFGQNRLMVRKAVNAQMAGRIYQPSPSSEKSKHMPSQITVAADKTPVAYGAASYAQFLKGAPRDLELDTWEALEDACQSLAPKLVDLMVLTAEEVN